MRRCAVCGADVSHRHGLAKYCSDGCVREARRPTMLVCRHCGVQFPRPARVGAPPRFCCEEHRVEARSLATAAHLAAQREALRVFRGARRCLECGADLAHRKANAAYCSRECSYASRGHAPRRPAMPHEDKLRRRRARRAALKPASTTLWCEDCNSPFDIPDSKPGRRPRRCPACRNPPGRREETACKGCEQPVPSHRGVLALYCSNQCQTETNNRVQAERRKVQRIADKQGRTCAVCGAEPGTGAHGLRKYCGRDCWYRGNYTPVPRGQVCALCGSDLSHRGATARYCGQECRLKDLYRRNVGTALRSRPCAQCGTRMPLSTAHRVYCSSRCSRRASFEADPEKVRAAKRRGNHQRRAMLAATARYVVTVRDVSRLWNRYGRSCAYCGQSSASLHQEHIVPIARGGTDGVGNLVPACPDCNLAKGDRTIMEWRLGKKAPRYHRPSGASN
ncbi:HNH endonuclease [Streptomyces olivaceus]|uniref:HNH endonuclease n=1 Tax=Streptomyces olivaceus TaxID=47716 RepID=UPI003558AF81